MFIREDEECWVKHLQHGFFQKKLSLALYHCLSSYHCLIVICTFLLLGCLTICQAVFNTLYMFLCVVYNNCPMILFSHVTPITKTTSSSNT